MAQCFITRRGGGTGNLEELPNLPTNVKFVVGNGKATITHTNPTRAYAGTYFVYKQGNTPQNINDGTKVDFGTKTSNTLTGLSNTQYYGRYFPYNSKKQIQTQYNSYGFKPEAFSMPKYTGQYTISGNTTKGSITMRTSGTLTLSEGIYDIFLVGGGGAGCFQTGKGGGSGYTTNELKKSLQSGNYSVTIGAGGVGKGNSGGGGNTVFGSGLFTAKGGGGGYFSGAGGSGGGAGNKTGKGGNGGSNGANGANSGSYIGGTGQGSTTRAFKESSNTIYAGGGGGGNGLDNNPEDNSARGLGGKGGGGIGYIRYSSTRYSRATNGTINTGGGGGGEFGGSGYGADGGSGITIIRWGY